MALQSGRCGQNLALSHENFGRTTCPGGEWPMVGMRLVWLSEISRGGLSNCIVLRMFVEPVGPIDTPTV